MASGHGPPWQLWVTQMSVWGTSSAERSNCQKRSRLSLVHLLSLQKGSGGDGQAACTTAGVWEKVGLPGTDLQIAVPCFTPPVTPSSLSFLCLQTFSSTRQMGASSTADRRTHTGLWFLCCLTVYMLPTSHLLEISWSPFSTNVLLPILFPFF